MDMAGYHEEGSRQNADRPVPLHFMYKGNGLKEESCRTSGSLPIFGSEHTNDCWSLREQKQQGSLVLLAMM